MVFLVESFILNSKFLITNGTYIIHVARYASSPAEIKIIYFNRDGYIFLNKATITN